MLSITALAEPDGDCDNGQKWRRPGSWRARPLVYRRPPLLTFAEPVATVTRKARKMGAASRMDARTIRPAAGKAGRERGFPALGKEL